MYLLLLLITLGLNATSDIIDRRVSRPSDIHALSLWTAIVQLLLICPFVGLVEWPRPLHLSILFFVGWFSSFARSRWYLALAQPEEKLSRLAPLLRLSSVIVVILAVVLLGESVTGPVAIGGAMMIAAGFLVSLERSGTNLKEFLRANRALGLVVIFAFSNALITVAYKYLLDRDATILTIYFFLKLFQCAPLLLTAWANKSLASSYRRIANIRLFVGSRVLQTVAALVFLLALANLSLTVAEPVVAVSPFLFLGWEVAERRLRLFGYRAREQESEAAPARTPWLRVVALTVSVAGFIFLRMG